MLRIFIASSSSALATGTAPAFPKSSSVARSTIGLLLIAGLSRGLRVLRLEALEPRLGVDERAVHAEVFRAHQTGLLRLRYHLAEEQLGLRRAASTAPDFCRTSCGQNGKAGCSPLLAEAAFAPNRVERHQQRCLQRALWRHRVPAARHIQPIPLSIHRQTSSAIFNRLLGGRK
jgi:hypothetical protein